MRNTCFYILIFSFLNYIGCYSSRGVNKESLYTQDLGKPTGTVIIITNDEKRIKVKGGIYELTGDTLYLKGFKQYIDHVEQIDFKIALDDIQSAKIEERDDLASCGLVIGAAAFAFLIVGIIWADSAETSPKSCRMEGLEDKG